MRHIGILLGLVCAVALVNYPQAQTAESVAAPELVGTWKLVTVRYGGYPDMFNHANRHTLMHITPTHSTTMSYFENGTVFSVSGGTYTLKDGKYTETTEYEKRSPLILIWGDSKNEAKPIKDDRKRTFDVQVSDALLILTTGVGEMEERTEWQRVRGK